MSFIRKRSGRARAVLLGAACSALLGSSGPAVAGEPPLGTHIAPHAPGDDAVYAAPTTRDHVGRIMAPVMINGQGPFRFIVDTGASRSAVSALLAAKLGLVPSAAVTLQVHGVTGAEAMPSVLVDTLQAGDIVLRSHRLPVLPAGVFANADGILGVEGFDAMRIRVDFEHDEILITKGRAWMPGTGWYRVGASQRPDRLLVAKAWIGKVAVKAVIDTGAERTLGNLALRNALKLDLEALQERTQSQVIGAVAAEQAANSIPAPMIRLGETEIRRVDVTFADLNVFRIWGLEHEPALVIGMDVLGASRALVFDYRRSQLFIQP